jgi:hypothetical protein
MNYIDPHWDIDKLKTINIVNAPAPEVGYSTEEGINLEKYQSLVSAGVHRGLPKCFNLDVFEETFNWINYKSYAVHKMEPGSILPLHKDKYSYYSTQYNIIDFNKIVRVIVFLEDYELGHILQIEDTPVTEWKAGNWVSWSGKKTHLAANFGCHNRYTLQITGLIK